VREISRAAASPAAPSRYLGVLARDRRGAIERIDDAWRVRPLDEREQLVADAVSRNREIVIRRVLAKLEPTFGHERPDRGPGRFDQRPHDNAGARMHSTETTRPRAAEQPQQKGLGLVVFGVGDGDVGRVQPGRRTLVELVARDVRRVFDRGLQRRRKRGDVDALDVNGQIELRCALPAETLVCIGIRATQEMIQVRDAGDLESLFFGNLAQQIQQRHRVGTTRKRDGHTASRGKQSVSANGTPDRIDDLHDPTGASRATGETGARSA
jgi:hypothetical protein